MPVIKPFDALSYRTETAGPWETLCCPPYDVVSEEEQRVLESRNPYNCILLERPLAGSDGRSPYELAAGRLEQWKRDGVLARSGEDAFYVYETAFECGGKNYTLRGLTGRCELSRFDEGQVLPHEETLSKAKADRLALMQAAKHNFSQIYALYDDPERVIPRTLSEAVDNVAPDADFTIDGITHRLWRVTCKETHDRIRRFFADTRVYVADGHHRYETALLYRDLLREQGQATEPDHPANYVMMTLVDMDNPGLVVLPTHRVVFGCGEDAPRKLLDGVGGDCDVLECDAGGVEDMLAANPGSIAMYWDGRAVLLTPRGPEAMRRLMPEACGAYRSLDVAVLHAMFLEPYFGIGSRELAEQRNLIYTRDLRGAMDMVDDGRGQCAFLLSPTKVSQIRDVSLAGAKMPQKSTYFYPKLITGLYFNPLER